MKKITENWSQTFCNRSKLRFMSSAVAVALLAGVASCDSDSDDDGTDAGTPVEPNTISAFTFEGLSVQPTITDTDVTFEIDFNKEGLSLDVANLNANITHNGDNVEGPTDFTGGPVVYTVTGEDGEPRTYNVSVKAKLGTQFVTTWSEAEIEIPTNPEFATYNYNIDVDNDGYIDETGITENKEITFEGEGRTVGISGQFPAIFFNGGTNNSPNNSNGEADNAEKVASVDQWGTVAWESMEKAFQRCKNLGVSATDAPNLSGVASMERMFNDADNLGDVDLSSWNTSGVENMNNLFRASNTGNPNISGWDISSIPSDSDGLEDIFRSSGISAENYSSALVRFAAHGEDLNLTLPQDINLGDVPSLSCSDEAEDARQTLSNNGWSNVDCN